MIRYHLQNLLQLVADRVYASIPQPEPATSTLLNCKIISHRGEHNNKTVKENTLAAFDRVVEQGIWGIEFDVRWTRDLHPVIIHDSDCLRVFGATVKVNSLTLNELQSAVPQIPDLDQVIKRYGKKTHLMVELKAENFTDLGRQRSRLRELFSGLDPAIDFHILALNIDMFELVNFLPGSALLPVAEIKFRLLSEKALAKNYAGICGQYLMISDARIEKHARCDQKAGTGFASSRYCFYRELNRGVEWIFTNHARKLHGIREELLKHLKPY